MIEVGVEVLAFRGMVLAMMVLVVVDGEVELGVTGRMNGIEINTRDVSRAERVDSGATEEVLSTTMKTGLGAEVTSAGWTRLMSAA